MADWHFVNFFDCAEPTARERGVAEAAAAVRRGDLVVLPTDTVYGIGADAFQPASVTALLNAKGRGRHMPPPVLVGSPDAVDELAERLPGAARDLIAAFWPGALSIVVTHLPTLRWDLGDLAGTVALRMPHHPVALDLLRRTGPMAVSSANLTRQPVAATAAEAAAQFGDRVSVYLEAGPSPDLVPSTIVDVTGARPRVVRAGAIPLEKLRDVVADVVGPES
ncbi:MAG TPA: L-threonylcarbamoyladenylate synthase [Micromonosporaceae bacterium]